jgi:hypothetical protein
VVGRIRHPSPAMIVACVALAVALGGVSYAATVVLPRASVGALQLKANSVNSSKVANGSLLKLDFKAGQLPAGPQGPTGPPGAAGAAGPAGGQNAGATLALKVATSGDATTTSSTSFDLLQATEIEVPTGSTATIVATFSAESACYSAAGFCSVRILIDGSEMQPDVGTDFAFDSTDDNTETSSSWESHAIVRYATGVAAGNHNVQVQQRVSSATTILRLDDWALSIVAYKA